MSRVYFSDHPCCAAHLAPEFYASDLSQAEAVAVLRDLFKRWHQLASKIGVVFWPMFGTLIGAYRSAAIVPYDDDIDIGIKASQLRTLIELRGSTDIVDQNEDWIPVYETDHDVLRISPYWDSAELLPNERYAIDGKFVDKKHGLYLDIFAFCDFPGGRVGTRPNRKSARRYYPTEWFYPLAEIEFEGLVVKAPRQADKILQSSYGPAFALPNHARIGGRWLSKRILT